MTPAYQDIHRGKHFLNGKAKTYSQPFRGKDLAMKAQHAGAGAWEFAMDRAGAHLLDLVDQRWELLEKGDLPQASKAFRKAIAA
jgi:hypothetical protein